MAQMHRKIERSYHRSRPARALPHEGRMRAILHYHIAEILFPIGKCEVKFRYGGSHLKPGLAQRLSGLPRNQCGQGFRGEG